MSQKQKQDVENKIITKEETPLDISCLRPEEAFTYLGEEFVCREETLPDIAPKNAPDHLVDPEGYLLRETVYAGGARVVDGHSYRQKRKKRTLYRVTRTSVDTEQKDIQEYGRPLIVRANLGAEVKAEDIFKLADRPAQYNNIKLKDIRVYREGDSLVEKNVGLAN